MLELADVVAMGQEMMTTTEAQHVPSLIICHDHENVFAPIFADPGSVPQIFFAVLGRRWDLAHSGPIRRVFFIARIRLPADAIGMVVECVELNHVTRQPEHSRAVTYEILRTGGVFDFLHLREGDTATTYANAFAWGHLTAAFPLDEVPGILLTNHAPPPPPGTLPLNEYLDLNRKTPEGE